jgi:flagellin
MGLRISTNIASIAAQRHIGQTSRDTERAMKQLASGSRFSSPGEDSASFAISERLRGQISGQKAAVQNADSAIGFIQVAEGSLNEQQNLLIRMRELAIQAASDTFSDDERVFIDEEYQQLKAEVDRIAKSVSYSSAKVLSGSSTEMEFHVGAYGSSENIIKFTSDANTTGAELGIEGLSVADQDDARDSLQEIDNALVKVAGARSKFGAIQSRMESVVNTGLTQVENLSAAHSRMADTNIAEAVSELTKGKILADFQASVLAQANSMPLTAARLLA